MQKFLVLLSVLLLSCAVQPQSQRHVFPLAELHIGSWQIEVQLADTDVLRAQGLMFQETAEPGMLLLYDRPQLISLWMRNTRMPLDVAFIDANWQIIRFVELEPFDETPVSSVYPVIAALELPRGWFTAKGIGLGTVLRLNIDQTSESANLL